MKRKQQIVLGILIIILGAIIMWRATYEEPKALTISEESIPSEIFQSLNRQKSDDIDQLQSWINRDTNNVNYLKSLIRFNDWSGKNQIYKNLIEQISYNVADYEEQIFLIQQKEQEARYQAIENSPSIEACQQDKYLAATYIWNYFKY